MKNNAIKNFSFSVLLQLCSIVNSILIPRLIINHYGSEANGLLSSLTQFLNYISLVEGGVGNVLLVSLYKPLASKDEIEVNSIINSGLFIFHRISVILFIYSILLGILYPLFVKNSFSNRFVFSLTVAIMISMLIQYSFSSTFKYVLTADQKIYIVYIIQCLIVLANIVLSVLIINTNGSLHLLELCYVIPYVVQAIVLYLIIDRLYKLNSNIEKNEYVIKNRWVALGHNTAYFIHSNTDIVLISLFLNLSTVSVYSVYVLVINGLKNLLLAISNVFSPIVGRFYALDDKRKTRVAFDQYEFLVFFFGTLLFGCCIHLLPSFAIIYTHGVRDANYYQPVFGAIISIAELIYCIRYPYVQLVYSAKRYRETSLASYLEALLNITISITLIHKLGLVGVAIGTLVAMFLKYFYFVFYVEKHILSRGLLSCIKRPFLSIVALIGGLFFLKIINLSNSSLAGWIKSASVSVMVFLFIEILLFGIFDKNEFKSISSLLKKRW